MCNGPLNPMTLCWLINSFENEYTSIKKEGGGGLSISPLLRLARCQTRGRPPPKKKERKERGCFGKENQAILFREKRGDNLLIACFDLKQR